MCVCVFGQVHHHKLMAKQSRLGCFGAGMGFDPFWSVLGRFANGILGAIFEQ